jgi:superfamily I DNA/RNA helicase
MYWNKGAGRRISNALLKLNIAYRRKQLPVFEPVLVDIEVTGELDESREPSKTLSPTCNIQPSIALLKWHQARGHKAKHLFVIGLDEDTCFNLDVLPSEEQFIMRMQFFSVLKCADEYLHLSCSMKRLRFGKWRTRRLFALLKDIEIVY